MVALLLEPLLRDVQCRRTAFVVSKRHLPHVCSLSLFFLFFFRFRHVYADEGTFSFSFVSTRYFCFLFFSAPRSGLLPYFCCVEVGGKGGGGVLVTIRCSRAVGRSTWVHVLRLLAYPLFSVPPLSFFYFVFLGNMDEHMPMQPPLQ